MRPVIVVPLLVITLLLVPSAAAEQIESEELEPGATFDHTFTTATTYTFHDHKNPTAEGTIMVMADSDGSTDQVDVQIRDDGDNVRFEPSEISIEVGDTVRWTNSGTQVHQIMAWSEGDEMDMNHMDHGDDHHDDGHAHTHDDGAAESPGPAILLPMLALAAIAHRSRS